MSEKLKIPEKIMIKNINIKSFKTLMIIVFIYPILPLGLFATVLLFYGFGSLVTSGFQHTTFSQVVVQFLLFSGGASGLLGGIMILINRINLTSLLLFLHGAVSYTFVAVLILSFGTNWNSPWLLHSFYIAISLAVVAFQLYLLVRKVYVDYQTNKFVDVMLPEAVIKTSSEKL
ncbi:hypothetical protein GCM10009133_36170 [Cocleimonas flava]|uniref:Uncharacterized protein n=1 Tax=Cocleimonas flava TaxID=634765 RepID=A0A4R1FCM7_9GAMM|nr:hypothetical protein [Cocleimonas flava]TCJ88541.1 hypothetical protein EV695_0398 [Cocleimonas flava]